jgi:hypothetical protein
MRLDGQTDTTKLTVAFSNFANAPKMLHADAHVGIGITSSFPCQLGERGRLLDQSFQYCEF